MTTDRLVAAKLVMLQVVEHEEYVDKASRQQQRAVEIHAPRGTIYDARGRAMAVSVPVYTIEADLARIDDPEAAARALAPVLDMAEDELAAKLDGGQGWITLAAKLDPPDSDAVAALGIDGLVFTEDTKRYYPMRELAAHVLGYVGRDNVGLAGLELIYDDQVSGVAARRPQLTDNRRNRLALPDRLAVDAQPGHDLHLTLDATIQHVVEQELARAVEEHRAKGGMAVILDPRTGAVLALAVAPTFNANEYGDHEQLWRIPPLYDHYEPGSTFKMVTAAAAFEANVVDPSDVIDCGMGQTYVFGRRIRDHHPYGDLTFREAIAKSSNVAAIKVGMQVGPDRLYETIRAFGFGENTGIDLPGEKPGQLRPVERWDPITPAYASFGQGLAVTPVQLAAAISAVANGGTLYRPFVVRSVGSGPDAVRTHPEAVRRVISESTARELERLLEGVVAPGGTGASAVVEGYRIAGKTGTAQKPGPGGYDFTHLIPNFIGFAPAREPVLAGVVAIDEPRAGITAGGLVAAPVFARVVERVMPYLGIPPEPMELEPDLYPAAPESLARPLLVGLEETPLLGSPLEGEDT
jgi:cell division protein FtsI (penicillin-binding protein 3)